MKYSMDSTKVKMAGEVWLDCHPEVTDRRIRRDGVYAIGVAIAHGVGVSRVWWENNTVYMSGMFPDAIEFSVAIPAQLKDCVPENKMPEVVLAILVANDPHSEDEESDSCEDEENE